MLVKYQRLVMKYLYGKEIIRDYKKLIIYYVNFVGQYFEMKIQLLFE